VAVDDNSARSKQSTVTGRSSRLLTLPFAQRDSQFLIANLELEIRATATKQTTERKSNRKYSLLLHSPWPIAIFHPAFRSVPRFSLATRHPSLVTALLIETPRLEIAVTPRKQSTVPTSNRDKKGFSKSIERARHYPLRPDIKKYSL
jgi:hypothetical protein